jgi:hypothetical protein
LPPNTSGNLIMIADCVSMSSSPGSCNVVQKLKIHQFFVAVLTAFIAFIAFESTLLHLYTDAIC